MQVTPMERIEDLKGRQASGSDGASERRGRKTEENAAGSYTPIEWTGILPQRRGLASSPEA